MRPSIEATSMRRWRVPIPRLSSSLRGGQPPLRGAGALRAWMEPDAFEEQRVEPLDFRIEGEKVLVRQRTQARGAGSGINLDLEVWTVWTFDDDLLVTRRRPISPTRSPKRSKPPG